MKTIVSYVSGCAGDFFVNCLNKSFGTINPSGSVTPSASIKHYDFALSDIDLTTIINNNVHDYIGSHAIDRLYHLPIKKIIWMVVQDRDCFAIWARRDAILRNQYDMLSPRGYTYDIIRHLMAKNKTSQAVETYLHHLENFNWTLNEMRLVQPNNQIDITSLLHPGGYQTLIEQSPELKAYVNEIQLYHESWLQCQAPFDDINWVGNKVAEKLRGFYDTDRQHSS